MIQKITVTLALLLNSMSLPALELERILELEIEIQIKNAEGEDVIYVTPIVEEAAHLCVEFPRNAQDIIKFFNQSMAISAAPKVESKCTASGVARAKSGEVVDWWLFQGGVGRISYGETTTHFMCEKGTQCCESLPHVCNVQP